MDRQKVQTAKNKHKLEHWKVIALILGVYDAVVVNFSYFFALLLRFDFKYSAIQANYLQAWERFTPVYTVACLLVFMYLRLYRSLWRFASYSELIRVIAASTITLGIQIVGILLMGVRMPISYFIIGSITQFLLVLGIRFSYRFVLLVSAARKNKETGVSSGGVNVMLIGAGNSGQMILREFKRSSEIKDHVVCFIDDNQNKWGRYIDGVPVVGGRDEIFSAVEKYNVKKIYLAIPSATASQKRDLLNICKETGCQLKSLPGIYQLASGELHVSQMRDVSVEDLLGREPIKMDLTEVFNFIHGKRVMITGAGGSIGSELSRQIASHQPSLLLLFDFYENNVYDVQLELKEKYPDLNLVVLIGSVRDSRKMFKVFEQYKPQIVYHAAAHKHVPLMEDSPCEAIKNNAIGTFKTAYAAMTHGCERFVLISTDKAVNPTNIMGASKRLCEMIIQSFDEKIKEGKANEIPQLFTHLGEENADKDGTGSVFKNIKTQFVAVRFGNVLGSNGSVIPIFKKQIAHHGPVTVTHPDIIRYFMTIPEAVSLVLQAGTYAKGGEIFVLDMGSPVKIDTLARNLIKLSGFKPDVDIPIVYTGLRPGEKLYEEKLMVEEGLKKTANDLIYIGSPIPFDTNEFLGQMEWLMKVAYSNKDEEMRPCVEQVVNTYHPANVPASQLGKPTATA